MAKTLFAALVAAASCASAFGQTVTVNSTGGADHATIAAALAAVAGNAATPDVVSITGGGPYDELIPLIATPVEIRGTGPARPVLLVRSHGAPTNDGLRIACDGDVVLENLAILPSTPTPSDDAIVAMTATAGGTLNLTLRDVLVTQNIGGAPAVTNPFALVDLSSATRFGDDCLVILGAAAYLGTGGVVNATIDGCVFTHFNNGTSRDGITFAGTNVAGACTLDVSDTVVSFCNRYGFHLLGQGSYNIVGVEANPVFSYRNGHGGVSFDGATVLEYVVADVTGSTSAGGAGWRAQAEAVTAFSARKCAVIGSPAGGFRFAGDAPTPLTFTIDECTLYDNGTALLFDDIFTDSALTVQVVDTIIAANATDAVPNYAVGISSTQATKPAVEISTSGLLLAGDHALTAINAPGSTGSPALTGIVQSDPGFVSTAVILSGANNPDYVDVASPAYFAAGSGNTPLSGYGNFVGAAPSGAADWFQYR